MSASRTPYLISRPSVVQDELNRFLQNEGFTWDYSDRLPNPSELVVETAGRLCYISFGTGRSNLATYVANILASRHGLGAGACSVGIHPHRHLALAQP